jgi:hypothetical protein
MSDLPLYRRLLGSHFDDMPLRLREMHDSVSDIKVLGEFKIERGKGWLVNLVAALGGLPKSGENVPLDLDIVMKHGREYWIRNFGSQQLKTVQWQSGDLLIEAGGPVRFGFRVVADAERLELCLEKTWFCWVPLPRFLRPRVRAIETECESGVNVDVEFALPWLGRIIRYAGQVQAITTDQSDDPQPEVD